MARSIEMALSTLGPVEGDDGDVGVVGGSVDTDERRHRRTYSRVRAMSDAADRRRHRGLPARGPDVPAARRVQGAQPRRRHVPLRRGERGLPGVLGQAGRRPPRLVRGVAHDLRLAAAVRQVVRRREAQRLPQRRRPPRRRRPRRPGRLPLGGRARRHPHDHLRRPPRRGAAVRQRPEVASACRRATASPSTCR